MTAKVGNITNYSHSTVYLKNYYASQDDKEIKPGDTVNSGAWIPGAGSFGSWIGNIGNGADKRFLAVYNQSNAIVVADTGDWGLYVVYGADATYLMSKAGQPSDVGHHVKSNSGYCLKIDGDWESFNFVLTDWSWTIDPWNPISFPSTVLAPSDSPSPTSPTGETVSLSVENVALLGPELAWAGCQLAWNLMFRPDVIIDTLKSTANDYKDKATNLAKAWKEMAEGGLQAYEAVESALDISKGSLNFNEVQKHVDSMVKHLRAEVKDLERSFVQSVGIEASIEGDVGVGASVSLGFAIDWDNPKNWAVYVGSGFSGGAQEGVATSLSLCLNGSPASGSGGSGVGFSFEVAAAVGGGFGVSLGLGSLAFGGLSVGLAAGEELKFGAVSVGASTILAQGSDAGIENVPSLALGKAGYWTLHSNGTLTAYGNAVLNGDGLGSDTDAVDLAVTSNGGGYIVLCKNGGIHTFGNAAYNGHGIDGDTNAVAIEMSASGGGYWILCENGDIHTFGSAADHGHGIDSGTKAVDIAITPDGLGYWILDQNGKVYCHGGSATNYGCGIDSGSKAVALTSVPFGTGYWILCEDGSVYSYGSAMYYGDAAEQIKKKGENAVDIGVTLDGRGYWIVCSNGSVYTYGYAKFHPTKKDNDGQSVVAIGISPLWEPPQEVLSIVDAKDIEIEPLQMGRYYAPGYSWTTASEYEFTFQEDGNLVLYDPSEQVLWSSNTAGQGAKLLAMQLDGELAIYKENGEKLWGSGTSGYRGTRLSIINTGDVRIIDDAGTTVWSTNTELRDSQGGFYKDIKLHAWGDDGIDFYPGDIWVTNANYTYAFRTQGDLVIYDPSGKVIWQTPTANQGADRLSIQKDGNVVIYRDSTALWATGTENNLGAFLVLENEGNLSVRKTIEGDPLWESKTNSDMLNLKPSQHNLYFAPGSFWETNEGYMLRFDRQGNLTFGVPSEGKLIWESKTDGKGSHKLAIQTDGNVVIYDSKDKPIWATETGGHSGAYLGINKDKGTLAVYDSNGESVWTASS